MVKLEEVDDEELYRSQPGPQGSDEEGDWDTDSESDTSSLGGEETDSETLLDRITALKDIIPPAQRRSISSSLSTASAWGIWGARGAAKITWLVGVSVMLVGIPYAVGATEDQMIRAEEEEREASRGLGEALGGGGGGEAQRV